MRKNFQVFSLEAIQKDFINDFINDGHCRAMVLQFPALLGYPVAIFFAYL